MRASELAEVLDGSFAVAGVGFLGRVEGAEVNSPATDTDLRDEFMSARGHTLE